MTTKTTRPSIEQRVELGAQWLDEIVPGWENRISTKTLDMHDSYSCICGQLFENSDSSGYSFALRTLLSESLAIRMAKAHYSLNAAEALGFTTYWDEPNNEFANLKRAWVELLDKRMTASAKR